MKFAVIRTGGKQYLVHENDEIYVEHLKRDAGAELEFDTLASGNEEKNTVELGTPLLSKKVKAQVVENVKGEKIRVARFRAKSRYRKVKGFRAKLSKVKIVSI